MAAKTLTRAQFKKLRPGGNYNKYLSYIAKHRPPPDPIMEAASAMVASQLAPIKQEYEWAAKERMDDALAASAAAKGFTAAFGRAQQEIPNSSGQALIAAANALLGYSGGMQGRASDIASEAGHRAAEDVARLSGMDVPMPSAEGRLAVPYDLAKIDAGTMVGRAPYVTSTLNALDTASRKSLADWADIQRFKGAEEAADIRQKWLVEAGKRTGLIQQAYAALRKDAREQRALDITAGKLRLQIAEQRLAEAKTKAEITKWEKETERARDELDAKIAGEGYYKKYPPKGRSGKTPAEKATEAKKDRDEILSGITGDDGVTYAKHAITDSSGFYTFGTKNLPRQRLIRLLASHYWPMLRNYAAKSGRRQLNDNMMKRIIQLVDNLAEEFPYLRKNYKPATAPATSTDTDTGTPPFDVGP